MDGPFDGANCFTGDRNGFHRHTQSGSLNHMALGFSSLMQPPPLPSATQSSSGEMSRLPNTNGGANYESHDDLCMDRCANVGLYNGSQFFNHRGAVPTMTGRWQGRTMSTHQIPESLYNFSPELDANAMHFRHELTPSNPNHYQSLWYGQQSHQGLDRGLRGGDEDCSSIDSCCDSQCTMTGKCSNIACANKEDTCTDQSCPERSAASSATLPSEVVDGANALISINHVPEQQPHDFALQGSGKSQTTSLLFLVPLCLPRWGFSYGRLRLQSLSTLCAAVHVVTRHQQCGEPSPSRPW